jgi:hypothetical protein
MTNTIFILLADSFPTARFALQILLELNKEERYNK